MSTLPEVTDDMTDDQLKDMAMQSARVQIKELIEDGGNYANNAISSLLRIVYTEISQEKANDLIKEFDLENLYGIQPVECEHKWKTGIRTTPYKGVYYDICEKCGYTEELVKDYT